MITITLESSPMPNQMISSGRIASFGDRARELAISAMQAVRGVSKRKIQAAYSLGASKRIVFFRVLLPASLPGIFTAIRVSIGVAVTMLVGAEMIATSDGIAWMALSAADFLLTDVVLVGVLIMALMGYLLDQLSRLIENRIVHWSGKDV